jgi:hypothetical protein
VKCAKNMKNAPIAKIAENIFAGIVTLYIELELA